MTMSIYRVFQSILGVWIM